MKDYRRFFPRAGDLEGAPAKVAKAAKVPDLSGTLPAKAMLRQANLKTDNPGKGSFSSDSTELSLPNSVRTLHFSNFSKFSREFRASGAADHLSAGPAVSTWAEGVVRSR
jgi:hypothetical protein